MAEKHKSEYKEPKDMAKSQKPEVRSDLKDYIKELVKDCMWEFSGEILPGPRKDDKWTDEKTYPFVHNHTHDAGKEHDSPDMVPDIKDADRAYPIEMMQDGDPKMYAHAKKVFQKNIEKDGEEYLEALQGIDGGVTTPKLKESIAELTSEQKETLIRKYIRNKIAKVLMEQAEEPVAPPAEEPVTEPAPDTTDAPIEEPAADVEPETEKTPEQKAAEQKAAEEKAKKDFTQVVINKATEDTVTGFIDTALQPLESAVKGMDGKKVKLAKITAIRKLLKIMSGSSSPRE